jgi:hypothetical protein
VHKLLPAHSLHFAGKLGKDAVSSGDTTPSTRILWGTVMSLGTWQPHGTDTSYHGTFASDSYGIGDLSAGERASPVDDDARRKPARQGFLLLCAILMSCGLPIIGERIGWSNISALINTIKIAGTPSAEPKPPILEKASMATPLPSLTSRAEAATTEVAPTEPAEASPLRSTEVRDVPPTPVETPARAAPPAKVGEAGTPYEPSAASAATGPHERLPPPSADPADPFQSRALAVGLHPGLSRVLLMRLSKTDYNNAGIAIRKAISETPDSDAYIWPRQHKRALAQFRVHFVQGAAPTCRRYVVTVTKDGWSTTASPMERCGVTTVASRH